MDRFIVATPFDFSTADLDLKSNMDRFIGRFRHLSI